MNTHHMNSNEETIDELFAPARENIWCLLHSRKGKFQEHLVSGILKENKNHQKWNLKKFSLEYQYAYLFAKPRLITVLESINYLLSKWKKKKKNVFSFLNKLIFKDANNKYRCE